MTDKKEFGSFLKEKRMAKGLSQKDLARLLFVTESAVSKWERGISYPDIALINDLCLALELNEHELITASVDTDSRREKAEARSYRKLSRAWFLVPTCCYLLALAVCLICNLAVSHTLSWFFVVFAALVCAFTFVPTVTGFFRKAKFAAFAASTLLSVCLLIAVCGIYTGYIEMIAVADTAVLLGYSLFFLPVVLRGKNLPIFLRKTAFLISFFVALCFTVLLLVILSIQHGFSLPPALYLTLYGFTPLFLGALVCLSPIRKRIRGGLCTIIAAGAFFFTPSVLSRLFAKIADDYTVDFSEWATHTNGNVAVLILFTLLAVGLILIASGFFFPHKK